ARYGADELSASVSIVPQLLPDGARGQKCRKDDSHDSRFGHEAIAVTTCMTRKWEARTDVSEMNRLAVAIYVGCPRGVRGQTHHPLMSAPRRCNDPHSTNFYTYPLHGLFV